MKVAKIRPNGERSWCVMEINKYNFGELEEEIKGLPLGAKVSKKWPYKSDDYEHKWGVFGAEFDGSDQDYEMEVEIIDMAEIEMASLREFDGW